MKLTAVGLPAFNSAIDDWLLAVEEMTVGAARGLSVSLFNHVIRVSPQYSGDFAGNWKYSVGDPDKSFQELGLLYSKNTRHYDYRLSHSVHPFIAGDKPAMSAAVSLNSDKPSEFTKLGQTIFLSNSSAPGESYAWKIENNEIKFRPGNSGEPGVYSAVAVAMNYATIGKTEVAELLAKRIGVGA